MLLILGISNVKNKANGDNLLFKRNLAFLRGYR
jgi:hypothetical protein